MYQLRPSLRLTLMAALVLFTMGCAATASAGSVPGIFLFIAALSVGGLGCFITGEETPQTNNTRGPGQWEPCCTEEAVGGMCFCPEGSICNYALTCRDFGQPQPDADMDVAPDADMGGSWEPCCTSAAVNGMCFCPAGVACNYAWTCMDFGQPDSDMDSPVDMEPDADVTPDLGEPDMTEDMGKGQWEPCCQNGQISSCFCPEGVACNYGWFTTCDPAQQPAVACALFEEQCWYADADMGKPDMAEADMGGSWEPCCQNGQISSCLCPEGAVCNYGLVACDPATSGVACVSPREMCPVTM